jgi:uncharacterized membrane protein YfcA
VLDQVGWALGMNLDPYLVLGSAVVGLLVGITGAGGGALMTPMLVLLFNVKPSSAISSDLVAAVIMRPFGAGIHARRGTVNWSLVGWSIIGSVPMALLGSYLLHLVGNTKAAETDVEHVLGAALLVGAAAMLARYVLDRRRATTIDSVADIVVRPRPTLVIGMVGGLLVGFTSVGAGSLMIVLLLFAYPGLGASRLVGTDLAQAVPLSLAAAVGALLFGQVELPVTASIVVGAIPAVIVGSLLSSRAPDRYIRPAVTLVIFASGLKYAGMGTTTLAWTVGAVVAAAVVTGLAINRPWKSSPTPDPLPMGASQAPDAARRSRS